MVAIHELIPQPRGLAIGTSYWQKFNRAQLSKTTLNRRRAVYRFTPLPALAWRRGVAHRPEPDHCAPMQFQKRRSATHLLVLAVRTTPIHPTADPTRQRHPRKIRLAVDRALNASDKLGRKVLPTNNHACDIPLRNPPCPDKKMWDMIS